MTSDTYKDRAGKWMDKKPKRKPIKKPSYSNTDTYIEANTEEEKAAERLAEEENGE